jgi:hypothetical protein
VTGERRPGQTRGRASNRVPGPTFDMKRALEAWPTVLGQTASNHGRKLLRPAQRHGRNDRFREGFRMPARSLNCAGVPGAGVRKPPKKEPAGPGERFSVYGDLIGQRLGRRLRQPTSLRADSRWPSRIGRCCCARQLASATVGGVASEFVVVGMRVARRRERVAPARGWCNEVAASVMALRF